MCHKYVSEWLGNGDVQHKPAGRKLQLVHEDESTPVITSMQNVSRPPSDTGLKGVLDSAS